MSRLTAKERKALPDSAFAGPGRSFPINDPAHIHAAESYERYASPATKAKIDAAASHLHSHQHTDHENS